MKPKEANIIRQIVPVSKLQVGDTIEIDNELKTVDRNYLKYCPFMGHTFKGDTHRHGVVKVTFVQFKNGK